MAWDAQPARALYGGVMSTLMIKLRDFTLEDAGSLAENANTPNVARYLRGKFEIEPRGKSWHEQ